MAGAKSMMWVVNMNYIKRMYIDNVASVRVQEGLQAKVSGLTVL